MLDSIVRIELVLGVELRAARLASEFRCHTALLVMDGSRVPTAGIENLSS
jgi:hypothetical protein